MAVIQSKRSAISVVQNREHRTELDSHADTCIVSPDTALITHDFETPVSISGYTPSVGQQTVKTVTGVVAYESYEGKTYYLHLHQALLVPKLPNNLICPMQLRSRGHRVNDEPKHMAPIPTESTHAITISEDSEHDKLVIPLSITGVIHYFPTRKPSREEYETSDTKYHIDLTAEEPTWDPLDTRFQESEEAMLDTRGRVRAKPVADKLDRVIASVNRMLGDTVPEDDLGAALEYHRSISAIHSNERTPTVNAATLAKRWNIGVETAKRTIEATTQRAVRKLSGDTMTRQLSNER